MMTSDDADAINAASAEPVPEVGSAPESIVHLIRGIREDTETGVVWHDVAEVRELTGEDEEYLASIENKKGLTYSAYMSALLARATVRIGGLAVNNDPRIVDKLILGDRDLLHRVLWLRWCHTPPPESAARGPGDRRDPRGSQARAPRLGPRFPP